MISVHHFPLSQELAKRSCDRRSERFSEPQNKMLTYFYVNRYIKEYSGKSKPLFFEGAVFKMTIPIPQMNGGVINEGIKSKVQPLLVFSPTNIQ